MSAGILEWKAVETAAKRERLARFLVGLITLATFGPYLFAGLRTEQLIVYLIGVLAVPVLGGLRPAGGVRFLLPWLLYIVVASLAVLMPSGMEAPQQPGSLLAGYDNLLAPLVIMLIIWTLVPEASALGVLTMFGKMLATIMALNGVLAMIATRVDITALLRPFWASDASDGTVAALAQTMGRYGGIFNQPAEAGIAYSIAGVAAIYVWKNRPGLLALVLVPITIGGLICVSKVFVLGGLPVIIVYWLIAQRGGRRIATMFALGLVALGVLQSGLLGQWSGFSYLTRLITPDPNSDGGALAFYTAGRLASNSTYSNVIDEALNYNPAVGVGAGGWAVPYDGAIPETLVVGGVIGLMLYAVVIVGIFTLARRGVEKEIRQFAFFFAVIAAGSCFGISPLTANRVSTLIWITAALLVLVRRARSAASPR